MTCDNCIHGGMCANRNKMVQLDEHTWDEFERADNVEGLCPHFKNKADFVEVVRCKDCEKCVSVDDRLICGNPKPSLLLKDFYMIGETRLAVVKPDDFCSSGRRKST